MYLFLFEYIAFRVPQNVFRRIIRIAMKSHEADITNKCSGMIHLHLSMILFQLSWKIIEYGIERNACMRALLNVLKNKTHSIRIPSWYYFQLNIFNDLNIFNRKIPIKNRPQSHSDVIHTRIHHSGTVFRLHGFPHHFSINKIIFMVWLYFSMKSSLIYPCLWSWHSNVPHVVKYIEKWFHFETTKSFNWFPKKIFLLTSPQNKDSKNQDDTSNGAIHSNNIGTRCSFREE